MENLSTYEEALKAWNLAGFKDGMIFSWIISEHKDICLELLQLILPDLGIVDVKNIKKEDTPEKFLIDFQGLEKETNEVIEKSKKENKGKN